MDNSVVLAPPVAFVIVLALAALLALALSRLAFRNRKPTHGSVQPYACGEDMPDQMIAPNYGQFLPFAFFFTILHVVALTIATVAKLDSTVFALALVYLAGAICGLVVLYRK